MQGRAVHFVLGVHGFGCATRTRASTPSNSRFAVYLASIEVTGEYFHFRPPANGLRQAVAAVKRQYRHPLVQFNNDPLTTLRDVQGVLDAAIAIVRTERSQRVSSTLSSSNNAVTHIGGSIGEEAPTSRLRSSIAVGLSRLQINARVMPMALISPACSKR